MTFRNHAQHGEMNLTEYPKHRLEKIYSIEINLDIEILLTIHEKGKYVYGY